MCGIFGGIGRKVNPGTIRALALINRERGTDSLGFFDSSGKMVKSALDPMEALGEAEFSAFIARACSKGWFVAGHTRHATRGTVTRKNAHPFRYGHIIGSHNGMVDAPDSYTVDSQYLFDQLRHADYQEALGPIGGYWGLTWFDGNDFFMQAHDNDVYVCKADGAYYYSSDDEHLAACVGKRKMLRLTSGATIRFKSGGNGYDPLPDFVSHAKGWGWNYRSKTNGKGKKSDSTAPVTAVVGSAVSAGSTEAADAKLWLNKHDLLEAEELSYGDDLAEKCGYTDLACFMETEGIHSEARAYDMLVDAAYADGKYKKASSWHGDDYVGGNY